MTSRRGVVLLLVLTSLALAAALLTPLASLSADAALAANRQADALRHRMAGDSFLAAFPAIRARNSDIDRQLDRRGFSVIELEFAGIRVRVRVEDDSAKLPLSVLGSDPRHRASVLQQLAASLGLPAPTIGSSPEVARCLDDLFESASDPVLFGTIESPGWAHVLTPLGSRIHVRRAAPQVLEAALSDLTSGIGTRLARLRDLDRKAALEDYIAALELTGAQRRVAMERLDTKTQRFSALVETTIAGERYRRYVILAADTSDHVLVDWEVAP